jgi:UDP-glucose 4-epimerase
VLKILITGGRGFLGRHLARKCSYLGSAVAGVGHGAWPQEAASAWGVQRWVNGEVAASNLDVLLDGGGGPDVIFHLAGGSAVGPSLANPLEDFERTVATTARLLEWVRSRVSAAKVICVSSAAVYGSGHAGPIPEAAELNPFSPYGSHKAAMELLCRSFATNFGLQIAIVRMFSVYGPELRKQLLWDICSKLRLAAPRLILQGTGSETRDWLEVSDAVELLNLATRSASPLCTVINGGTGRGTTVRDVSHELIEIFGEPRTLEFTGVGRSGDPESLVADPTIAGDLGFKPQVSLTEGLARYATWFKSQATP